MLTRDSIQLIYDEFRMLYDTARTDSAFNEQDVEDYAQVLIELEETYPFLCFDVDDEIEDD